MIDSKRRVNIEYFLSFRLSIFIRTNAYLKSLMFQDYVIRLLTRGGGFAKNKPWLALNLNRGFSWHIFQNIF